MQSGLAWLAASEASSVWEAGGAWALSSAACSYLAGVILRWLCLVIEIIDQPGFFVGFAWGAGITLGALCLLCVWCSRLDDAENSHRDMEPWDYNDWGNYHYVRTYLPKPQPGSLLSHPKLWLWRRCAEQQRRGLASGPRQARRHPREKHMVEHQWRLATTRRWTAQAASLGHLLAVGRRRGGARRELGREAQAGRLCCRNTPPPARSATHQRTTQR